MTPQICKTLISLSLKTSPTLYKPSIHYTTSLFFFSSEPKSSKHRISCFDYLTNQHNFSPESALKASKTIAYIQKPENSNSILLFLKESGFSKTQLERVIKGLPCLLLANLDKIKPKIKIFQDLDFSPSDIAKIITSDPRILHRSTDNALLPAISVLKSFLGSNEAVCKLLKVTGWFFKHDLERTMLPNIEFMKSCGISSSQILGYMFTFPRLFLNKPEKIKDLVKRVDEMGFNRNSNRFISAVRTMSAMTLLNWERKLKLFRSLGFSEDDIHSAFRRMPHAFATSEKKIKEVTELLLSRGNIDICYIVAYPELLMRSVERTLKPRLGVLDILERKNLLKRKPGLAKFCNISHKKFMEKYVLPYSDDLGDHLLLFDNSSASKEEVVKVYI